jgi:hypothetical protein
MFLFLKVGYIHLATTLHLKVGNWQQCLFQMSVICIFTKMFSREVTYIFQGFVSKVGYMHLLQQFSFSKVDYMCPHYNNVLSRSTFHPKAIFNIKVIIKKGVHMYPICPSEHTTSLRRTATCTIYIKLQII